MISLPAPRQRGDAAVIATNLRRLMARHGLTFVDVVEATGLDERTIRGVVRGANHPHARTLHKLAQRPGRRDRRAVPPAGRFSVAPVRSGHQHAGRICRRRPSETLRELVRSQLRRALQPLRRRRPAHRVRRARRRRGHERQARPVAPDQHHPRKRRGRVARRVRRYSLSPRERRTRAIPIQRITVAPLGSHTGTAHHGDRILQRLPFARTTPGTFRCSHP